MGANAKHALGTTLSKGASIIAEITEIGGIDMSADTIDTTTLDAVDGYRTFIQGLKDAGEVSISGFFYPGDTNGQAALLTAFNSGTADTYTITFPANLGASWSFTGIVTAYTTGATLEDPVTFEATIKVSGKPVLNVTPSAGITAIALSTGATLNPAFSTSVYNYQIDVVTTTTSFTMTFTAANHTMDIYVNGTLFQQGLASDVASSSISLPNAGDTAYIQVFAKEASKIAKEYKFMAFRATA